MLYVCLVQVEDYAARKQMEVAAVERWCSSILAYDHWFQNWLTTIDSKTGLRPLIPKLAYNRDSLSWIFTSDYQTGLITIDSHAGLLSSVLYWLGMLRFLYSQPLILMLDYNHQCYNDLWCYAFYSHKFSCGLWVLCPGVEETQRAADSLFVTGMDECDALSNQFRNQLCNVFKFKILYCPLQS